MHTQCAHTLSHTHSPGVIWKQSTASLGMVKENQCDWSVWTTLSVPLNVQP